jgi:hypothetical protein
MRPAPIYWYSFRNTPDKTKNKPGMWRMAGAPEPAGNISVSGPSRLAAFVETG